MENSNFKKAIELSEKIRDLLAKANRSLPYNLNVIDELHANENAHSRILCKLLQYKDAEGKYRILESFIKYIANEINIAFEQIKIEQPEISQEKERIDLWIRDKSYAIIMENKIEGAIDQYLQLQRYIDKTKISRNLYNEDNIYIVYLPADSHEPSEESWGKYKKVFMAHYANVSFQRYIIPWLKKEVLPYCTLREDVLSSAIRQYIDYLEGMFGQRESQKKRYHMESEWLKELGLEGDFSDHYPQIKDMLEYLADAQKVLQDYRRDNIDKFMETFSILSKQILSSNYGGNWGEKGTLYNQWYFLYNENWCTGASTHIEWSDITLEDVFVRDNNKKRYKIKLHVEGEWSHNNVYISILNQHLGKISNKHAGRTTFWYHVFDSEIPLGLMTKEELTKKLTEIYSSEHLKIVIDAITQASIEYEIIAQTKNNNQ